MNRYCSIVLNAHVPWVRHPEVPHCLEEDWLHSTVVETHLPLLESLFRLRREEVPFRFTVNLSPTLLAMWQDPTLKARTLAYLDRTLALCGDESGRGDITGRGRLASAYEERLARVREFFVETLRGDLVAAYADLRDSGHLELTASAATHGILPLLMRVPESAQAQVRAGIRQYVQSFGRLPRGFWLPECAYAPALSRLLKGEGIEWTVVEEHALTTSPQADGRFPFQPGVTPEGLVVFGRDQGASSEVWSAEEGFPCDERYRDFMRDIGLESPIEYLAEYLGDTEQRQFTGIKYYRLEQGDEGALPYDPELAALAVEEHALRFVSNRGAQLAGLEAAGIASPHVVCAFDADLFGHWWYEGVDFLEQVFRNAAARSDIAFVTPAAYLATPREEGALPASPVSSSWGEGGYFEMWTSGENFWVQEGIQSRAEMLSRYVRLFQEERAGFTDEAAAHRKRCIRLMTRELLLAQSSDWGFLMRNDPSRDYAEERVRAHFDLFDQVWRLLNTNHSNGDSEGRLDEIEDADPIFNDLPWNVFEPYL